MEAKSANDAWTEMLGDLLSWGRYAKPRAMGTKELLGYQTVVDMKQPVVTVAKRIEGKFHGFMCAEAAWILSGDNRVTTIAPYSRMIAKFSDDGRYFRGAYGPKIVDQLTYVVDSLVADPDTRQAVINIWRENPRPTKDVPCTLSAQWVIRNGVLHCFDTMRSSDAWLGWPFDVFNFSVLSHAVALLIRERGATPPAIGELRLTAASQHVYERNFAQAQSCVDDPKPAFLANPLDPFAFADVDELIDHLWSLAQFQIGNMRDWRRVEQAFLEELAA
jgi:thymidylate synthase